jgi:hypothetical protein
VHKENVDRPSEVDFVKAITDNIPSKESENKMWLGVAAYFAYKGYKKRATDK